MLTDATLPLLRRTPLLPGESLLSLVERLTQLNHYAGTAVLTQLCQVQQAVPCSQDKVGCPLYGATFLLFSISQVERMFYLEKLGQMLHINRLRPAEAFERLKEASQHRNLKLREIALRVIETGAEPDRA